VDGGGARRERRLNATSMPALDGLRGIAILLVMLYHANRLQGAVAPDGLSSVLMRAGWCGVDLFFALSGFLITRSLLATRDKPRYFLNFYARRFLRIFPLYYAFLLALFLVVPLTLAPGGPEYARLSANQGWYWSYLVNVLVARDQSWVGTPLNTGHLWSLAVEEQFYLVWPLVVLWLGRRGLAWTCLACLPAAWLCRIGMVAAGIDPVAGYVLAPARMDALAAGALVAAGFDRPRVAREMLRWSGPVALTAFAVVAAVVLRNGRLSQTDLAAQAVGYPALALGAAALVLRAARSHGVAATRTLSHPFLRAMGRYSYAIYLFHDPVNLATERWLFTVREVPRLLGSELPGQLAFGLVSSALTLSLAVLSWHLLEKRCLAFKRHYAS
jgi:peptidoglycan/LPS O-acetylase OafA/YrhL